jgi:hypothetical protein
VHWVYRVALGSVHGFYGSTGRSDRAACFEALVVAVSFEVHLLPCLLGTVTSAVDSGVSTGAAVVDSCHQAQLQGTSPSFGTSAGYWSPKAANLAKTSSVRILWIGS